MKRIIILLTALMGANIALWAQSPASHPGSAWSLDPGFTDEFEAPQLDLDKWNNDVGDWGTWSWEPDNAYLTDSALTLRMRQDQHVRGGTDYYFTSGILRNRQTRTYGYFETRIKASAKGQGTCPAFWMYSVGQPVPTEEGGVQYSEIDAIEIFQIPNDSQRLEMNLHTRIIEDGVLTWKRPGQGNEELCRNTWLAPWDPRDDYHTYGVWNRLDSIFWYVDGVQRGAKKNFYWHLPMYLTVSMGLRTPYEKYIRGVRTPMPYPDSLPEPGFPTEMFCDYVRVWNTSPQLYADPERYENADFPLGEDLEFEVRYFAGTDEQVESSTWNGVFCKLQEITSDGTIVQERSLSAPGTVGNESGLATFQFSLSGLLPSDALPSGNQYILTPAFRTSYNGGEEVYLAEQSMPINLVSATDIEKPVHQPVVRIQSDGADVQIEFGQSLKEPCQIEIYDTAGRRVYADSSNRTRMLIPSSAFPTRGMYTLHVFNSTIQHTEKLLITFP